MKLMVLQSAPHSGTKFVVELLRAHPSIEPEGINWGRILNSTPDDILLDPSKVENFLLSPHKDTSYKYIFLWSHFDKRLNMLTSQNMRIKFIAPMRNPLMVLRSNLLRGDNYKTCIPSFEMLIGIIEKRGDSLIIPVDIYANMRPQNRLQLVRKQIRDYLSLELTYDMERMILDWAPIGQGKYKRELNIKESKEILELTKSASLFTKLEKLGFIYEDSYFGNDRRDL